MLDSLRDIPIVGDVRGTGYFRAIELVKRPGDQGARSRRRSASWLLRGFLSPELFRRGLICRADDRGDPVIQLSPPLIAGPGAVRGDRGVAAPRARGGVAHGCTSGESTVLHAARPPPRPRRPPRRRRGGPGPPVRWVHISELAGPDAVAVGRRAAADHRACSSTTPERSASTSTRLAAHELAGLGFGTGFAHDELPDGAARGGRGARLPALRGPLRGAVHRDHREGVHAPGQRAVRGAPARALRARAARADRALRARARRRRGGARRR